MRFRVEYERVRRHRGKHVDECGRPRRRRCVGEERRPLCGPVRCDVGMFCCNAGCGICAPPGGGCVAGCPVGDAAGASDMGAGFMSAMPTCGETINQYCQSDASTCQSGAVARDWGIAKQQASKLCIGIRDNVYVQECGGYGIVNGGGVDDDTVFYYDLATSTLIRVEHYPFGGSKQCIAGVSIGVLDCPSDGLPASLCGASDGGVDL